MNKLIIILLTFFSSLVFARFIVHNDGTLTDKKTNLMWQVCTIGQTWQNNSCGDGGDSFNWSGALEESNKELYGYSDWRVPNIKELLSIAGVASSATNVFDNTKQVIKSAISDTISLYYWSNSISMRDDDKSLAIDFYSQSVHYKKRTDNHFLKLVRQGQHLE